MVDRFFHMVLSDLTADKFKAEEDLENLINDKTKAEDKSKKARELLVRIDEDERAIDKLHAYMPDESSGGSSEENNENEQNE